MKNDKPAPVVAPKIPPTVRVRCVTTCADSRLRYEAGQTYTLRVDSPVMQHFERLEPEPGRKP